MRGQLVRRTVKATHTHTPLTGPRSKGEGHHSSADQCKRLLNASVKATPGGIWQMCEVVMLSTRQHERAYSCDIC